MKCLAIDKMKMHYKLLVFDWDGTLMDSESHIVASMQAAMGDLGLEQLPSGAIRNIIGLGMREAVNALYPEQRDEDFIQAFAEAYRGYYLVPHAAQSLFPGAREVLHNLLEQGYLLAVATGKSRRGLNQALEEYGMAQLFHGSRCADETQSKPHPQMLLEIIEELHISPGQTIMIGDTEYDMEMAQKAGSASIAATYGVHHRDRLLRYNPLYAIDEIKGLDRSIAQLNMARIVQE